MKVSVGSFKLAALTTLVNDDFVCSTRTPLQHRLEIKLLRQARTTLVGRISHNQSPAQATRNFRGGESIGHS